MLLILLVPNQRNSTREAKRDVNNLEQHESQRMDPRLLTKSNQHQQIIENQQQYYDNSINQQYPVCFGPSH